MKYVLFCALMCALTLMSSGCASDINGNPCLPALSGCGIGADTTDGGSVDISVDDDGGAGSDAGSVNTDTSLTETSGSDTLVEVGEGKLTISSNVDTQKKWLDGWETEIIIHAKIWIDGKDTNQTTPTSFFLSAGKHTVLLKRELRLQWQMGDTEWNQPLNVVVMADASAEVKINLYYDSEAYWEDVESTETKKWKMKIDGPSDQCPDGGPYILSLLGRLCLESPTQISICKNKNPACDWYATGKILNDGKLITVKGTVIENSKTFAETFKNKGL